MFRQYIQSGQSVRGSSAVWDKEGLLYKDPDYGGIHLSDEGISIFDPDTESDSSSPSVNAFFLICLLMPRFIGSLGKTVFLGKWAFHGIGAKLRKQK